MEIAIACGASVRVAYKTARKRLRIEARRRKELDDGGFDVDGKSAMGKLCAGRRGSVAKTCSAVPGSRHPSVVADRAGLLASSSLRQSALLVHRANQWASMDVCDKKARGMRRHHELFPLSCVDRSQRGKGQDGRKEERNYHDQSESRTDCRGCQCPRCDRELHLFNTASGPILRCRGWSLAGTPCTLIKACHDGAVVTGGLQSTNRTGGGSSASGSGGPGTLPRRDDGTQDPPPINDWTAQVQALVANPAWATGTIRSVATSPSTASASPTSTAARGGVDNGSREFNVLSQDTLLLGATKRVKLDDGSHLNVMDDSDLNDFIHHHACSKGTRLLSHEKIECTCWEISQA